MEEGIKRCLFSAAVLGSPDVVLLPPRPGAAWVQPTWWDEVPEDHSEALTFMRAKLLEERPA